MYGGEIIYYMVMCASLSSSKAERTRKTVWIVGILFVWGFFYLLGLVFVEIDLLEKSSQVF